MFVVAVAELSGDPDAAVGPIAAALGLVAHDVRSRLARTLPSIVVRTASEEDASRAASALRALGHGVVLCDSRSVAAGRDMVRVRRFALDPAGIFADGDAGEHLAYADLAVLVIVAARTEVERTLRLQELVGLNEDRAPVEMERTSHERVTELSAYLFPREERRVWLLREHEAQYLALGPAMRLTSHENFLATVARLRAQAPTALYDDRFATSPRHASQAVRVRDHQPAVTRPSDAGIDLTVHLLVQWLTRPRGGPYR
jgi:hypothetical protein